jgi:hypothetical protein
MDPEWYLPCLQDPATGSCPEPVQLSVYEPLRLQQTNAMEQRSSCEADSLRAG